MNLLKIGLFKPVWPSPQFAWSYECSVIESTKIGDNLGPDHHPNRCCLLRTFSPPLIILLSEPNVHVGQDLGPSEINFFPNGVNMSKEKSANTGATVA